MPTLDEITFPGITLVGTSPTFCKIKVTAKLSDAQAVMGGTFPATPVVVFRHTPRPSRHYIGGMKPLESRTTLLQYFEAFKAFV
ncbi:hypothetical protein BJV78DRAFT_618548 [Lactifluus subvellereus]|nr:hypothetical protein BJV78DRAFT_618548 [Lactifluus subvellereus]